MVISNYVLWPLASALNAHLVPEPHRRVAGHIITVPRPRIAPAGNYLARNSVPGALT